MRGWVVVTAIVWISKTGLMIFSQPLQYTLLKCVFLAIATRLSIFLGNESHALKGVTQEVVTILKAAARYSFCITCS